MAQAVIVLWYISYSCFYFVSKSRVELFYVNMDRKICKVLDSYTQDGLREGYYTIALTHGWVEHRSLDYELSSW
jgi:hypothetical protein